MGEGEFRVELREREPGPTGARRGRLPDPAEPGPAVRPGRGDRLGRRALARRARARRRRRRRDARLRRDRRRHRRRHRPPRGRDAEPARGAGPGDHDHPPAADRERRRAALPGREGARRPDPHADRGALARRAPRRARAHARRRGVPLHAIADPSSRRDRGRRHRPARAADEGSRQAASARRPRDHRPRRSRPRLGRGARRLGRPRRRQRLAVELRPVPESRPARARPRRASASSTRPGGDLFDQVSDGETAHRARRRALAERDACSPRASSSPRSARSSVALADQQSRVTEALEAFADNTLRHLRDEGKLLADGIDFPPLKTRFRDRHAVVVARGPGYKRDLRIVRPYIRNFKPVLVAVDGGADALLEIGLKPHVIVGDFDSVSDAALRCGAELLVHAYADGRAPGSDRLAALGLPFATVAAPGISEDIALLLAHERGRRADRRRRDALQPRRVHGAQPRRHGVDVRDPAQGGRGRSSTRRASRGSSRRGRHLAARHLRGRRAHAVVVAVLVSPALRNVIQSLGRSIGNTLGSEPRAAPGWSRTYTPLCSTSATTSRR